ncbi:MAG: DNA alkylation repair protein [Bacteroidia bacterium]
MEPLKEMFNKSFYERLALEINKVDKKFQVDNFVNEVIDQLEKRSLNERLRNTSIVLKRHLPKRYEAAVELLTTVAPSFNSHYTAFLFPDFIGLYGHDHYDLSIQTLKYFTQFGSSEFAIREFLKRDFDKTIRVMNKWAEDDNYHVRRLASEGSRPRLPWSFKLDEVIKNPKVTKSILEKLKNDDVLYVKKSVANHLNDISKENTDYMLNLICGWNIKNEHTAWIIKHASRTLIKKGHSQSLAIFDFEKEPKIKIENFKLSDSKIKIGSVMQFNFTLISDKSNSQKLVIDYIIHYFKKAGTLFPKVFKLKEIKLAPKQTINIIKTHAFQQLSTRKLYEGNHFIELVVNGKSYIKQPFTLNKGN